MRLRPLIFAATLACLALATAGAGEILNIGDPAPPLTVSKWVKGEKVERFEPGRTYVVEFWSTLSAANWEALIPHVTELARKYKDQDVRFVGVDVFERDTRQVAPFVAAMGEKMDYSVALDDVPKGAAANDGAMAKGWIRAAEENTVPIAFVVHDGKIAWIGHPTAMDDPLARIVAGDRDFAELARNRLSEKTAQRAARRKAVDIQTKIYTPYQAGNYKATLAGIDEVIGDDPGLADQFAMIRFLSLCHTGDGVAAVAVGETLYEKYKDQGQALNNVFFYAVDLNLKIEPDPRVSRLALKALRRADELTNGQDMAIVDSLAVALFRTGNLVGAALTEAKALKILEAEAPDRSHPYYKTFEDQLIRFRKAAVEKAKKR